MDEIKDHLLKLAHKENQRLEQEIAAHRWALREVMEKYVPPHFLQHARAAASPEAMAEFIRLHYAPLSSTPPPSEQPLGGA